MKKKLFTLGILATLGIAYTGSSWYFGNKIRSEFTQKLPQIESEFNSFLKDTSSSFDDIEVKLSIAEYEQNIFSSNIKLKLSFNQTYGLELHQRAKLTELGYDSETELMNFNDALTIFHGPLPIYSFLNGDVIPKQAVITYQLKKDLLNKELQNMVGNKPLLTMETKIDLSGNTTTILTTPAIDYKSDGMERNTFISSANKLTINQTTDMNKSVQNINLNIEKFQLFTASHFFNLKLNIDDLYLTGSQMVDLVKQNINTNLDLQLNNLSLLVGEENLDLNNISLKTNAMGKNCMNSIKNIQFDIDQIIYGKQNLGQFNSEVNFTCNVNINHAQEINHQTNKIEVDIANISLDTTNGKLSAAYKIKWSDHKPSFTTMLKKILDIIDAPQSVISADPNSEYESHIQFPVKALAMLSAKIHKNKYETVLIDPALYNPQTWLDETEISEADRWIHYPLFLINNDTIESNILFSTIDKQFYINSNSVDPSSRYEISNNFRYNRLFYNYINYY